MIYSNHYRKYRSFGHSRLTSAMLAPPVEHVLVFAAFVGVVLGVFL